MVKYCPFCGQGVEELNNVKMNEEERTNCDIYGSIISNGKCDCGYWKSNEEMKYDPIKQSLEAFHEMKVFTLTGDSPHLGAAVVFFRGDYNDCKKIDKFIHQLKGRSFYGMD